MLKQKVLIEENRKYHAGFEVLTVVVMKSLVF
jgi:hypothetical protein